MIDHPIVDSHVHLVNPERFTYAWADEAPSLNRSVLPDDVAEAAAPYDVEQFVFVEVDIDHPHYMAEVEWITKLAAADARIGAIVPCLPVERGGEIEEDLDRLCENGLVKSIRRLIQSQPDPEFCIKPDFIAGLKLLGQRDIAFDICVYHHQLPAAIEMVRQSPDMRFILDHIAKPCIRDGLFDPRSAQLRELAAMENVSCKISGVITEADHQNWTRDELRPYIEHAIDCFGMERCMFGSDWHVLSLAGTYSGWVEIIDWVLAGASADERNMFFRDNTRRYYRIEA